MGEDPRLAGTKRKKFVKSGRDVLNMFSDKTMSGHSLASKDTSLGGGHGLHGTNPVESGKQDPLKMELEKMDEAKQGVHPKKPKTYSEHTDRLKEVYDQYVDADSSMKKKKLRKK